MNLKLPTHSKYKRDKNPLTEEKEKIIAGCSGTTINLILVLMIRVAGCQFLAVCSVMWWVMNMYVNIFLSGNF